MHAVQAVISARLMRREEPRAEAGSKRKHTPVRWEPKQDAAGAEGTPRGKRSRSDRDPVRDRDRERERSHQRSERDREEPRLRDGCARRCNH
jgi:hypothetical protein